LVGKAFLCDLWKNVITIPMGIRRAICKKKLNWKNANENALGATGRVRLTERVKCTPVVGAGVKDDA
jgi:hypothetical protein